MESGFKLVLFRTANQMYCLSMRAGVCNIFELLVGSWGFVQHRSAVDLKEEKEANNEDGPSKFHSSDLSANERLIRRSIYGHSTHSRSLVGR